MIRRNFDHPVLNGFGQRINALRRVPADYEWSLDLFAGVGGWSRGYEAATGYAVDHACNHDHQAIECHHINHPATKHHEQSVWDADPRELEPGRRLGYLHLSPDCTDFSKAKGGRPVSDRVRGLAWVAPSWMYHRRPRVVTLENVEEFQQWGPLEPTVRSYYAIRGVRLRSNRESKESGLPRQATISMHRVVMGVERGDSRTVDHRNHNTLDNRKSNLRVCTTLENNRNTSNRIGSVSKYLGVVLDKRSGRWRARITIDGRRQPLGHYSNEIDAAIAYDRAALKHFGEFANPNILKPETSQP